MSIRTEIIEALHNYSYRCVGKKDNIIIFAKPMGYSVVTAEIIQNKSNFKLEMTLIVKNTDGENLVWTSEKNTLENIKNDEEYVLDTPIMASAMDSVVSPSSAVRLAQNGVLGVLNLHGLWIPL